MRRMVGLVKVTLGVLVFYGMGAENLYDGGVWLLVYALGALLLISGAREVLTPEQAETQPGLEREEGR